MRSLLFSILCLISIFGHGQDYVALTDSLNSQFFKVYKTNTDSAQLVIQSLETLAKSEGYVPAVAYAAYFKAKLASQSTGLQEAIALYEKARAEEDSLLAIEMPESWKNKLWSTFTRRGTDAGAAYIAAGAFEKSLTEFRMTSNAALMAADSNRYGGVMGRIGAAYFYLGEQDSATYYIEKQKAIGIALGDIDIISVSLSNLSFIYRGKGEFAKSLISLQEGKDAISNMDNSPEKDQAIATLNFALASLLYMRDDYQQAKKLYLQAHDNYMTRDGSRAINLLYELGDVYKSLDLYDSSAFYYLKSLKMARNLDLEVDIIYIQSRLSDLYFDMGDYERSEAYADSGLVQQKVKQLAFEGFFLNKSKAELLLRKSQARRALAYANTAQSWSDSLGVNMEFDKEINDLLYRIHKKSGNLTFALKHLELFKTLNDSLRSEAQTQEFTIVDQEHKAEKERLALVAEQEKTELSLNNKLQQQRVIQYSAFAGFGLVCLLAISFYRSYRTKQKDNAHIQEQANQLAFSNQQLQELSSFKDGLTHMIAHDMKNSLNVILGLSENESEEKMKQIHQSGGQLLSLVLNMLDIQKFEEAQIHLNPSQHSIQKLISEAVLQVELLAYSEGLTIERELEDNPAVHCNDSLIVRVLVNLLTNAIKYSSGQSSIKITSNQTSNDFLTISIVDYGSGIHEDDLPHVFEKFWQTDARKTGHVTSTGLGLTFCKLAIEAHDGDIQVTSTHGKGSTFTFTLPIKTIQEPVGIEDNLVVHEEKNLVQELAQELRKLQVYQAGEIFKILNRDEARNMQSPWAQELRVAVEQSDTEKYRQLVDLEVSP
ncbi:MAG: HAMP domain-containing sensor histidine kinase [Cytophagales bacterium]|nr:HAMP domain-containing sensor histidine kinase [Cytophagales bacterium]